MLRILQIIIPYILNFSWPRVSKVAVHLSIRFLNLLNLNIILLTVYSSYLPQGECSKTKKLTHLDHFLHYPKIVLGLKHYQKRVFIKYGHCIYSWKAHGKEISNKTKGFWPSLPTSYITQKSVPGPQMSKHGCSLIMVVSFTVGKPIERRFQKLQKSLTHSTHSLPHPKVSQSWTPLQVRLYLCCWKTHRKQMWIMGFHPM